MNHLVARERLTLSSRKICSFGIRRSVVRVAFSVCLFTTKNERVSKESDFLQDYIVALGGGYQKNVTVIL